ncbi:MAG TPA: hypothetical protein PLL20_06405 [Phycisphaerae bacterium]|nr:hypothetical protein [Phycisphaerae bacterium]HRR86495.1 hypothetical protein [Phycisphaerae bacterium]
MLLQMLVVLCCCEADPASEVSTRPAGDSAKSAHIRAGDLDVVFLDNSESPGVLSGIASLINVKDAPGFNAFDPDSKGAAAGLNFEHIIAGHENPHNAFTPRHGPYRLYTLPDGRSVMLVRNAADDPWAMASTMKYTVTPPHYIDFEFRCRPADASLFGRHRYAILFWANYMNDVEDVAINFRGIERRDGREEWIRVDAPPGHPDHNHGGTWRHVQAKDLPRDDDLRFRLNSWSYEYPRFSKPFYYGRAAKGMTYILMFDRAYTPADELRFSLFKFKLDKFPRPAWDFQYVIHPVEQDREYGYRARAVWKKFISPEDCLAEYESWARSMAGPSVAGQIQSPDAPATAPARRE